MKFTLEFDGTEDELIQIAEYQIEDELDSRDLGDAMGAFITLTMLNGNLEDTFGMPGCDHIVRCTIENDLFSWEGITN
jgi:hypothetical protein